MNEPKNPSYIGLGRFGLNILSKQILGFVLKYIEDPDIKPIIQHTYELSSDHLEKVVSIFEQEQYDIPNGFTEKDMNMNAPWLFYRPILFNICEPYGKGSYTVIQWFSCCQLSRRCM